MVVAGGLVHVGCALPVDPPVEETLGSILAGASQQPVANLDPPAIAQPDKPKKPTPEELEAAEDAKMERRIRAMAHYAAGVAHRERGERKEASEEFYHAALADPTNEKVVMEVVRFLLLSRQKDKLFQLLIKATKDPDAPANLHALLAATYLERKKPELAKVASENAIRKGPKLIVGYKSLMQIYRQETKDGAKRTKQIRKVLDRAMAQTDVPAPYQVELALMLLGYLELDKKAAEELKPKISKLLDEAWADKPKRPILLENLARAYRGNGIHDKAALVMESLLKLLPNNPAVLLETARGHALTGKMDQAKIHLDALIKKFPKNWQGHQLRAAIAMDQDEYSLAVKHYREAIKIRPRLEQVYYDLISALLSDDKPDDATQELRKAKDRFQPNFQQAYFTAMIHLQKDEFAEAHKHLLEAEETARKTDPDRLTHFLYFQLGSTAERAAKYKDAEKYFRKSIAIKPDYATALNYLGYMWADRNENLIEAKKFIGLALKEQPDNSAFLDSMAWAVFREGDYKEALRWQLKALKHAKEDDPEIFLHLGEIYHALKNDTKAREYLDKALTIKDVDAGIKTKIKTKIKALSPKK
jgi:tetratricopeptide (TPR) repeat protein